VRADADAPYFTLLEGCEVFAPEPLGQRSILIAGGVILRIGAVDAAPLRSSGLGIEVIDGSGCVVIPGLVDPHQHLIGAGGEQGFASRMPEVPAAEIARAGITTVVGCLGTDTITRNLGTLLGKVRQLDALGISAYLYTGGFQVPPPTLTTSVMSDLILIDKVIGVGEIAISDARSSAPTLDELARLVCDARVGGTVGGKAGVTHFHIGPGKERLAPLSALLDRYEVVPESIYATHINRTPELVTDAIALARRGAYVDMDTIDEDLIVWLRRYREGGGPMDRLTASSDAHTRGGAPRKLFGQLISCCRESGMPLAEILPLFTCNPAAALKLPNKGRLREQADADLLLLSKPDLDLVHVFARGRALVRSGQVLIEEGNAEGA
jgi:beta-aspartyl-dipeptidase (metallo-type)